MSSRLEEIRARAERATPGPWQLDGPFIYKLNEQGVNHFSAWFQGGNRDSANEAERTAIAEFCAHAREDVPYLLGEVERLREALEEIAKIRTTQGSGLQAVDIANRALASTQEGA